MERNHAGQLLYHYLFWANISALLSVQFRALQQEPVEFSVASSLRPRGPRVKEGVQ